MQDLIKSRTAAAALADRVIDQRMAVTLSMEGVNPSHFKAIMREALLSTPDVVKCSESSIAKAVRICCQLKIVPDGRHAAIVPFKGEATLLPMAEGLKVVAADELDADIRSGAIYEGDNFTAELGSHGTPQKISNPITPDILLNRDPKKVAGSWCSIMLPDEPEPFVVIFGKSDIDRVRKVASQYSKAWADWPDRMAQKSVIKRAITEIRYKRVGMNSDKGSRLFQLIDLDNDLERDDVIDITPKKQEPAPSAKALPQDTGPEEKPPAKRRRGRPPKKQPPAEPKQPAKAETEQEPEHLKDAPPPTDGNFLPTTKAKAGGETAGSAAAAGAGAGGSLDFDDDDFGDDL